MQRQKIVAISPISLSFLGLLIGQFIAVLDVQIVTASLIVMQASIGAGSDQISWVQSAYLIAETIGIPIGAYLVRAFGFRRSFEVAGSLFVVSSLWVGLASSLEGIVAARCFQGFFGGLILPLAFTFGFSMYRSEQTASVSLILQ